jgi:hypothetical protein
VIFDLIMSLVGTYGGRRCRRCEEAIDRRDAFAMSEGVCRACGR